jgi:hypothetical protein
MCGLNFVFAVVQLTKFYDGPAFFFLQSYGLKLERLVPEAESLNYFTIIISSRAISKKNQEELFD